MIWILYHFAFGIALATLVICAAVYFQWTGRMSDRYTWKHHLIMWTLLALFPLVMIGLSIILEVRSRYKKE